MRDAVQRGLRARAAAPARVRGGAKLGRSAEPQRYAAARSWGAARALLLLTGQAGIGCEATFAGSAYAAGRMAAANREFDQLSTMATALLNKVS